MTMATTQPSKVFRRFKIEYTDDPRFKAHPIWVIYTKHVGELNWKYVNYHYDFEGARLQTANLVDSVTRLAKYWSAKTS